MLQLWLAILRSFVTASCSRCSTCGRQNSCHHGHMSRGPWQFVWDSVAAEPRGNKPPKVGSRDTHRRVHHRKLWLKDRIRCIPSSVSSTRIRIHSDKNKRGNHYLNSPSTTTCTSRDKSAVCGAQLTGTGSNTIPCRTRTVNLLKVLHAHKHINFSVVPGAPAALRIFYIRRRRRLVYAVV